MIFYNDSISNYILFKKFILILSWFFHIRSPRRLISFKEWLSNKYNFDITKLRPRPAEPYYWIGNVSLHNYLRSGIQCYGSHNAGLFTTGGYLEWRYPKELIIDLETFKFNLVFPRRFFLFYKWVNICVIIGIEPCLYVNESISNILQIKICDLQHSVYFHLCSKKIDFLFEWDLIRYDCGVKNIESVYVGNYIYMFHVFAPNIGIANSRKNF